MRAHLTGLLVALAVLGAGCGPSTTEDPVACARSCRGYKQVFWQLGSCGCANEPHASPGLIADDSTPMTCGNRNCVCGPEIGK